MRQNFIKINSKITPYINPNKIMCFRCREVTYSDVRWSCEVSFDGRRYLPEVVLGDRLVVQLCDVPFVNRESCLEFISQVTAELSNITNGKQVCISAIESECRKMECEVCGELIPQIQAETSQMFTEQYLCQKCMRIKKQENMRCKND